MLRTIHDEKRSTSLVQMVIRCHPLAHDTISTTRNHTRAPHFVLTEMQVLGQADTPALHLLDRPKATKTAVGCRRFQLRPHL